MAFGLRSGGLSVVLAASLLGSVLPSCTDTVAVSELTTALDTAGARRRNVFFTDTNEIHCVATVSAGRNNATLHLRIRQLQRFDYQTGRFLDADRVVSQIEVVPSAGNNQQYSIALVRTNAKGEESDEIPFQPGRYQCEALVDGELERKAIFNVDFPACPDETILMPTACYGFYELGRRCPAFGASSTEPAQCVCDFAKGWDCPQ